MSGVEPIDDTLEVEVDTQGSANGSEAHPFQVHLYCLPSEFFRVAHWLADGGKIPVAPSAPHALRARAVQTCLVNTTVTPAIRA